MTSRAELEENLKALESRLRDEMNQVEGTRAEIARIRKALSAMDSTERAETAPGPATPADKVALFRSLFRGREDVYPRYWENPKKKGKDGKPLHGYKPVCANENDRALCDWPTIKCSE
jgi:hypothetical protein